MGARSNTARRARKASDDLEPKTPLLAPVEHLTVAPASKPEVPTVPVARQVVIFSVSGQRLAVPIEDVHEVQPIVAFAGEGFGGPVVGMIDLRGHVVAALDAAMLLGLGETTLTTDSQMLILDTRGDSEPVALLVDQVDDVVVLAEDALHPAPSRHPLASQALGVFRRNDQLVTVLDPRGLVAGVSASTVPAHAGVVSR